MGLVIRRVLVAGQYTTLQLTQDEADVLDARTAEVSAKAAPVDAVVDAESAPVEAAEVPVKAAPKKRGSAAK